MRKQILLAVFAVSIGVWLSNGLAQAPATFDTKPAFMQVFTNLNRITNAVVVTNYIVVTNASYVTNLYNAQGQLLQPVDPARPSFPGLVPIESPTPAAQPQIAAKAAPDPASLRMAQIAVVRELLLQSLLAASNTVAVPGTFGDNRPHAILMPESVTSFDRKKGQIFLNSMNAAAEKAAPEALAKISQIIAGLNPPDPAAILNGGKDAATAFLAASEGQNISNQLLPIAQKTALDTGVREAYRNVMLKGGGFLGTILGSGTTTVDTDAHITKGLQDAILADMTAKEASIRADPSLRKTKILQDGLKP